MVLDPKFSVNVRSVDGFQGGDKKLYQAIEAALFEFELLNHFASAFNKLSIWDISKSNVFSR